MLLMFLDHNGWSLCCCQRFLKTTSAYLSLKLTKTVCFKTGEIFYLDPLTNDNKYELTLVFKNVTKYLSSFKAFKEKTWKISDLCYTHTCQDDTISCGVYVCFFVEKLVKRQKELLSDHVYPNEYRNFIKDFLIN